MSNGSELKSAGAAALRAEGFVPLPRWWVLVDEMDAIEKIAKKHQSRINEIRAQARRGSG